MAPKRASGLPIINPILMGEISGDHALRRGAFMLT